MITAIIIAITEKFYRDKIVFSAVTFSIGFVTDIAIIYRLLYR